MEDVLFGLLAKERPRITSVLQHKTVSYRDLSVTEIRYVQSGKYWAVRSYHTECWLSAEPSGPVGFGTNMEFNCNTLSEVAEITEYDSLRDLQLRPWPSVEQLTALQEALNKATMKLVTERYRQLEPYTGSVAFKFTPYPMLLVVCVDKTDHDKLLGTIAIDTQGGIQVMSKCDRRINQIAGTLLPLALSDTTKETVYEQDC